MDNPGEQARAGSLDLHGVDSRIVHQTHDTLPPHELPNRLSDQDALLVEIDIRPAAQLEKILVNGDQRLSEADVRDVGAAAARAVGLVPALAVAACLGVCLSRAFDMRGRRSLPVRS